MDDVTRQALLIWDDFQRDRDPRMAHMRNLIRFEVEEEVMPGIARQLRAYREQDKAEMERKR